MEDERRSLERAAASFGARLRTLRERAGLTQEELAFRAGLSPNAVSALERGTRRRPQPHTVRSLSEALELSEEQRAALLAAVPQRGGGAASRAPPGGAPRPPTSRAPTSRPAAPGRGGEAASCAAEEVSPASPAVSALPHPATPLVGRER